MSKFFKTAVGPAILLGNYKRSINDDFAAAYLNPGVNAQAKARKLIKDNASDVFYKPSKYSKGTKQSLERQSRKASKSGLIWGTSNDKKIRVHEMTHYVREKQKKWSATKYYNNPLARVIEETAANKRSGNSTIKSLGKASLYIQKNPGKIGLMYRSQLFKILGKMK